jgi:hypothetical protein
MDGSNGPTANGADLTLAGITELTPNTVSSGLLDRANDFAVKIIRSKATFDLLAECFHQ